MSFLDDVTSTLQRSFSSIASPPSKYYTVGITGASGLLGTALIDELGSKATLYGKPIRIVKLSRTDNVDAHDNPTTLEETSSTANTITVPWNPKATDSSSVMNPTILSQMDAIVHLAGENVATGLGPLGFLGIRPWTVEKKREILDSRVGPTQALAKAIAASSSSTKTDFLVASGVGVYGSNFFQSSTADEAEAADEQVDVSSTTGFLADVSRQWEAAAAAAASNNNKNRVIHCRMGVVLSKNGGALGKLYPIFFLGGGGVVGSGRQYFSFISARDAARALVYTLETPTLANDNNGRNGGPVNVCAPVPCTNQEFTSAMGKVLARPTIFPLPSFVVSLLFGEMGEEMLLGGVKAVPSKLEKSGFVFQHRTIEEALASAVKETI